MPAPGNFGMQHQAHEPVKGLRMKEGSRDEGAPGALVEQTEPADAIVTENGKQKLLNLLLQALAAWPT